MAFGFATSNCLSQDHLHRHPECAIAEQQPSRDLPEAGIGMEETLVESLAPNKSQVDTRHGQPRGD